MSARMIVVRGDRRDIANHMAGGFEAALAGADVAAADDLASVLRWLEAIRSDGETVDLAVIGPDVARPLHAGRQLRRVEESLGLVFMVPRTDVEPTELRVSMVPELSDGEVIAADAPPDRIADELRRLAEESARQRGYTQAIDAINRQLMRSQRREDATLDSPVSSVSASYLAALVRHVPDAIISVDRRRRVVSLNEAAVSTLGLGTEGLGRARLDADLVGEPLANLLTEALNGVTSKASEIALEPPSGRWLIASVTAGPVRDRQQRIMGAVLVVRDVTERHEAEERLRELQKAQSLATLAGGVAHDFNNLLVTVRSWAQLAADDPGDTETLTLALQKIEESADRASDLARSMLVYGGRGRFQLERLDVTALVTDMMALLRGSISRRIDLDLDLAEDLSEVHGDVTQLRQVLLNLATNAAEAIGDKPGTITIRTRETARDTAPQDLVDVQGFVVIEVSDTGSGMGPETLDRVFDPFFTTKFEGRGLGLAASQGIVRGHGGTLVARSEPGEGATFLVALPAQRGTAGQEGEQP